MTGQRRAQVEALDVGQRDEHRLKPGLTLTWLFRRRHLVGPEHDVDGAQAALRAQYLEHKRHQGSTARGGRGFGGIHRRVANPLQASVDRAGPVALDGAAGTLPHLGAAKAMGLAWFAAAAADGPCIFESVMRLVDVRGLPR